VARTVVNGVRSRIARREVERQLAARALPEADTYVVAVHFPDFPVNLYQLRQWYEPLRRLSAELPVVVIARYATTARALLAECPVPVTLARSIGDVETLLAAHPVRAVLYVNQNVRSFSVMRYRDPSHVFISHGESDKDYMASNQLKAYDTALVAGPAAVERLRTRLIGYDVDTRTRQIGRPQVDVVDAAPDLPEDGRTVVLYAPTWEGDRPSMTYGSVASHGEALVTALLADRRHRVVFRPHPRTGSSDPAAAAAVRRISRLLGAANRQDPTARHLVDTETPFGWHLHRCDACVTDISAVAYDWLATAKPLVVTEPADPESVVDRTGLVGALDLLRADEAATLPARLEALQGGEGRTEHADLVAHYYGDVTPGASMARFLAAVRAVVEEREAVLRTRGDAGP
jgi:hypothetical protein